MRTGEFREYYPFDGTVQPAVSVYLDVEEGGRVEQIVDDGGQHVEKGDLILRFSNPTLQRNTIQTEGTLLYNLDIAAQHPARAGAECESAEGDAPGSGSRDPRCREQGPALCEADQGWHQRHLTGTIRNPAQPDRKYPKDKRALMAERIRQEDEASAREIARGAEVHRLRNSPAYVKMLQDIEKGLEVRAPISGELSTIDAQVGQNINAGQRIGQIDLLDKLKVNVAEHQESVLHQPRAGRHHRTRESGRQDLGRENSQKVYPEVKSNAFAIADAVFIGETPESLKRGQTLTIELTFSAPSRTLMVNKGSFYQETAGRWVYLLSKDGRTARKTVVRLGRTEPAPGRSAGGAQGRRSHHHLRLRHLQCRRQTAIHRLDQYQSGQQMIIETENLKKIYRTDVVETTAVDDVNFSLSPGQFVSVMGPSGCGKSTLLHVLGLIDSPSGGSYRFMGEDVAGYPESKRAKIRKAHIGFVFQSFNLIDELTVYENVELPLIYAGVAAHERKGRARWRGCSRKWISATAVGISRLSCPAVSSSVSRSLARIVQSSERHSRR